jgi:death-on-curing protein
VEYLTAAEVLLLHARLIQRTGGDEGVRDLALLESALARPQATFEGRELYPDLWTKAAALMESLIRNHPFVDGNKRAALVATAIFLELNGHELTATNDQVLDFTRRVVRGEVALREMGAWLKAHSRPLV